MILPVYSSQKQTRKNIILQGENICDKLNLLLYLLENQKEVIVYDKKSCMEGPRSLTLPL